MPQYGGKTQYGGLAQYGGQPNLWLIYYRVLKSIALPGLWPNDDDAVINKLLRTDSKGLSQAKRHIQRLFSEIFPHTAEECLPEWADLLGVIFAASATLFEKRDAVIGKWRGAKGPSLPALREALFPLLRPSIYFSDGYDDGGISLWYTLTGNGTRSELGTTLTISLPATVNGEWDGTDFTPNANRVFFRLPDIDDGWTLDYGITSISLGGIETAGGVFVMADAENVTQLVAGNPGTGAEMRIDQILEGTLTEDIGGLAAAVPAYPEFFRIRKLGTQLIFSTGDTLATLTTFATLEIKHKTREIGFFCRNVDPSLNTVSFIIDSLSLTMDTPENNVLIVEMTEEVADLTGIPEEIYRFFVHRNPSDPGDYQLAAAQRLLDSISQGHTLGVVGESIQFLTDDPFSLTNRDLLGA